MTYKYIYTVTYGPTNCELHIDRNYVIVHVYTDGLWERFCARIFKTHENFEFIAWE